MSWKKILFGSYDKESISKDGRVKTSISIQGGLLVNVLALLGLIGLIWWLIGLFT